MKRRIFSFIFISLFAACGSPASAVSPIQKTEKFIEYYLQPSVMEAEIGAGPGTKPSDWLRTFLSPQFSAGLLREEDAYADSSPAPKLPRNFIFIPAGSTLESSRAVTGSGDFHYIFLEADDVQRRVRMEIYGPAGSGFVYEKEFLFSGP